MKIREITTTEIGEMIGINPKGNEFLLNGLNLCNRDSLFDSIISYAASEKLISAVEANKKIRALFTTPSLYDLYAEKRSDITYFLSNKPEEAFYKLHIKLHNSRQFYEQYNFPPKIGVNCDIASSAIIEVGVIIGDNVVVGHHSTIKRGSVIGNNVYIGIGTVIGSEGFQNIKIDGKTSLIPHVAGCKIKDNVKIFDNTCVCNSLFEETTVIGSNTMIDNLVHIAHNCIIGENCTITAGTILCGSTVLKENVWLAPNSSVLNKVVLHDNSVVGLGAVVLKDVNKNDVVVGNPAKLIKK